MTREEIEERIAEITNLFARRDDEAAHSREDVLYVDFINACAEGRIKKRELAQLARRVLLTRGPAFA